MFFKVEWTLFLAYFEALIHCAFLAISSLENIFLNTLRDFYCNQRDYVFISISIYFNYVKTENILFYFDHTRILFSISIPFRCLIARLYIFKIICVTSNHVMTYVTKTTCIYAVKDSNNYVFFIQSLLSWLTGTQAFTSNTIEIAQEKPHTVWRKI